MGMESPTWAVPLPADQCWVASSPGVLDAVMTASSKGGAGAPIAAAPPAVGDREPSVSLRLRPMDVTTGGMGSGGSGWGALVAGSTSTGISAARVEQDVLGVPGGGVGAMWMCRPPDGTGDPGATNEASMNSTPASSEGNANRSPASSALPQQFASGLGGGRGRMDPVAGGGGTSCNSARRDLGSVRGQGVDGTWAARSQRGNDHLGATVTATTGEMPATSAGNASRPPVSSSLQLQSGMAHNSSTETPHWAPSGATRDGALQETRRMVLPVAGVTDLPEFPSSAGCHRLGDCSSSRPTLPVVGSPAPATFSIARGIPSQSQDFFQPNPVETAPPKMAERSACSSGGQESPDVAAPLWSPLAPSNPNTGLPLGAPPSLWSPLLSDLVQTTALSLSRVDRAFVAVDNGESVRNAAEDRDKSSGQDEIAPLPADHGASQLTGDRRAPLDGKAPPQDGGGGAPPPASPPGGGESVVPSSRDAPIPNDGSGAPSSGPAPAVGGGEAAMARVTAVVEATASAAANEWLTANFERLNPPPPPPVAARLSNCKAAFVSRASRRARVWALTQELTAASGPAAVAAVHAAARQAGDAARDEWKATHREEREAARAQVRIASDEVAYAPVVGQRAAGTRAGAAVARLQAARHAVRTLANKASAAGQRAAQAAELEGLEVALWRAYGRGEGKNTP